MRTLTSEVREKEKGKEIDKYLKQGHLLLKVQRIGGGKDTKYIVQPAD